MGKRKDFQRMMEKELLKEEERLRRLFKNGEATVIDAGSLENIRGSLRIIADARRIARAQAKYPPWQEED